MNKQQKIFKKRCRIKNISFIILFGFPICAYIYGNLVINGYIVDDNLIHLKIAGVIFYIIFFFCVFQHKCPYCGETFPLRFSSPHKCTKCNEILIPENKAYS